MAFVREDEEDETKPGEANTQLSSAGGQVITGQGAPAAPTSSNPQSSGRFQNLQNYMNVNREQAGEFGEQISNTLTQGVDDAKTTLNTEVDAFGNEVDGGTVKWDETLAGKSAQEIAADGNLSNQYTTGKQGQYGGPQDFTSNQGITNLNQAGERVQNTGSFSGMQSTVKDILTPQAQNYSRGEQTLDSVFLTRPEENRVRFSGLRDSVSKDIPQAVETAQEKAQGFVTAGVQASTAAGQQYRDDFDGRTKGIQRDVDAEVIKQNATRQQETQAEIDRRTQEGGGLDEWGNLGYEQSSTPGISGQREAFNPAGYVQAGDKLQGANVLSDAQIAELKALEQLSSPEYWSNPYATGRQDPGAAYSFDESGFQQAQQQHNQVGNQMKQAYGQAVSGTTEQAVNQIRQNPTNPDHANQVYNSISSNPIPPNPQGYRTYGEYLAREFGITDGVGMSNYFLKTSAPQSDSLRLTTGL